MLKTSNYINFFCFLIPAFILVIPGVGEVSFVILTLFGFFYCYQQKVTPLDFAFSKAIAVLCLGYFLVALISILASDISLYAFKRLGTNYHFLVVPWLVVLLIDKLDAQTFSLSVKIGAILAGSIAIIQYFYLGQRAHGVVNAIPFADLVLLLSFFSLINIHKERKNQKWLSIFACILGLVGVVLSLSRGAWITAPFLFIFVLYIWYKQQVISFKSLSLCACLGISIIVATSLSPQVQLRFNQMQQNISTFELNNMTSVGIRLTLWKIAVKAIPSHPVLGFGLHNTKKVTVEFNSDPILNNKLLEFGHFHNEYLTTLVGKGIIGLIALLAVLIYPFILFHRYLFSSEKAYLAGMVMILCSGYAFFGLTNLAFGHGIMNTFFIFILAACSALLQKNNSLVS